MNIEKITVGKDVPNNVNVIIEIPIHSGPVKYELDKEMGTLIVDRFMSTPMYYPCNYGFVPHTLSDDGDPVDVLVYAPMPLISGSVIACRPVGMLRMTDEAGEDAKVLAVPVDKISPSFKDIQSPDDIPDDVLAKISHFFEHYKDLEDGKWVKLNGWGDADEARAEIMNSMERYNSGS